MPSRVSEYPCYLTESDVAHMWHIRYIIILSEELIMWMVRGWIWKVYNFSADFDYLKLQEVFENGSKLWGSLLISNKILWYGFYDVSSQDALDLISGHYTLRSGSGPFQVNGIDSLPVSHHISIVSFLRKFYFTLPSFLNFPRTLRSSRYSIQFANFCHFIP